MEENINAILDISKQKLDDYTLELLSLGHLKKLGLEDYKEAYNRIVKLERDLAKIIG